MTNDDVSQTSPVLGRRALLLGAGAAAATALTGPLRGGADPATAAEARATAADCGTLVHQDGFGTPSAGAWTARRYDGSGATVGPGDVWSDRTLFPPARYAIVPDPAGSGESVMRFTVPADQTSYRSEVARRQFDFGRYRYGVSHFVPDDYVPYRYGTILAQWHGYTLPDGRATNPPLALLLNGAPTPTWQFHVYRLQADLTTTLTRHVLPVPATTGSWHDWTIDITWSTEAAPGRVVVANGGATVLDISGVNNYHQQWPPYFQTGIYRASWKTGGYPAQPDLQICHRRITVHDLRGC